MSARSKKSLTLFIVMLFLTSNIYAFDFKTKDELGIENGLIAVDGANCAVKANIIFDEEQSKSYVGFRPLQLNVLPVHLKVQGKSRAIKVIPLEVILIDHKGNKHSSAVTEIVIDKFQQEARKSMLSSALMFGLTGLALDAGGTVSFLDKVNNEYKKKTFKPQDIKKNETAEGVIFFDVPQKIILSASKYTLLVPVKGEDNAALEKVEVPIPIDITGFKKKKREEVRARRKTGKR